MSKIPGPPIGYVDILDGHTLEKSEKDQAERHYTPLRPSAAGKCTRELAYEFMEYRGKAQYPKEQLMPDQVRLFSLGHSVEWNLLKQFEDIEFFKVRYRQQVVSFFKLTEEEWIEGSIDMVFWSDKWKAVGDVKSKKDKFSSWTASQWDEHSNKYESLPSVQKISDRAFYIEDLEQFLNEVNDPFLAANFLQLNMYANSQFLIERGIDHAVVIQYNKNDSRLRELRFKPSAAVYERVKNKFIAVQKAIDVVGSPEAVEKDYSLGSIKCAFCNFNKQCWPTDDGLKAYFATWPDKEWAKDTNRLGADGQQLEALFKEYNAAERASKAQEAIESEIARVMDARQLTKVKTSNGLVYELKFLKSPKPHYAIRRGKP